VGAQRKDDSSFCQAGSLLLGSSIIHKGHEQPSGHRNLGAAWAWSGGTEQPGAPPRRAQIAPVGGAWNPAARSCSRAWARSNGRRFKTRSTYGLAVGGGKRAGDWYPGGGPRLFTSYLTRRLPLAPCGASAGSALGSPTGCASSAAPALGLLSQRPIRARRTRREALGDATGLQRSAGLGCGLRFERGRGNDSSRPRGPRGLCGLGPREPLARRERLVPRPVGWDTACAPKASRAWALGTVDGPARTPR